MRARAFKINQALGNASARRSLGLIDMGNHHITIFAYDAAKVIQDTRDRELKELRSALSPELRYKMHQDKERRPEEDVVLAMIVGQIELEQTLEGEYDSLAARTKGQAFDLQNYASDFYNRQRQSLSETGSWFDEHRETMKKHAAALDITLDRVRDKVESGYQNLHSRIASLDYDAEQSAEEELAQMDAGGAAQFGKEGTRPNSQGGMLNPDLFAGESDF